MAHTHLRYGVHDSAVLLLHSLRIGLPRPAPLLWRPRTLLPLLQRRWTLLCIACLHLGRAATLALRRRLGSGRSHCSSSRHLGSGCADSRLLLGGMCWGSCSCVCWQVPGWRLYKSSCRLLGCTCTLLCPSRLLCPIRGMGQSRLMARWRSGAARLVISYGLLKRSGGGQRRLPGER